MTDREPDGPYVYQPYGSISDPEHAKAGRLWGVGGISLQWTAVVGLTRREAEAVVAALRALGKEEGIMTDQPR